MWPLLGIAPFVAFDYLNDGGKSESKDVVDPSELVEHDGTVEGLHYAIGLLEQRRASAAPEDASVIQDCIDTLLSELDEMSDAEAKIEIAKGM